MTLRYCNTKILLVALSRSLDGKQPYCLSHALLGLTVSGRYIFPVDDLPDLLEVISLDIVVLEVVGVLPHVHPKQRHKTLNPQQC